MANKLQQKFPLIRTREQVMLEIQEDPHLTSEFYSWKPAQREKWTFLPAQWA